MGAELARKRAGKSTETGMSEKQLREFASKPVRKKHKRVRREGMPHANSAGYYPLHGES